MPWRRVSAVGGETGRPAGADRSHVLRLARHPPPTHARWLGEQADAAATKLPSRMAAQGGVWRRLREGRAGSGSQKKQRAAGGAPPPGWMSKNVGGNPAAAPLTALRIGCGGGGGKRGAEWRQGGRRVVQEGEP